MTRRIGFMAVLFLAALVSLAGSLRADEKPSADVAVVLRQALKEKRVVGFIYHGHARTVEPHALGKGSEDKPVLLAWQTAGGSQTEPPPGWRVFQLAEIEGVKLTDTIFAKVRPGYGSHKMGRGLKSVEAEVTTE